MKRYAGVLLPVTSLPSKYGIGCFDQAAYDFVDWLQKAGQRYWQILPLGATSYGLSDDSPYQAYSAFAGNPYLISLDTLVEEGVLTREECDGVSFGGNPAKVDFDKLHEHRFALLHKAYERSGISADADYQNFIRDNGWWLNDYALFMALKTFFHDQPFRAWPEDIRMHWGFALEHYNRELYFDIEFQKYMQFKFNQQWSRLKAYANAKHIQIVGDIPIYVSPPPRPSGRIPSCSSWTNTMPSPPSRAARRMPLPRTVRPGEIPCTTGISTAPRTLPGGSAACGTASSSTTWCALTISGALTNISPSPRTPRPPEAGIGRRDPAWSCSIPSAVIWGTSALSRKIWGL